MITFSLSKFASFRKCDINLLRNWLALNGFKNSFNGVINIEANEYQKILRVADVGIRNDFNPLLINNNLQKALRQVQSQLNKLDGLISSINGQIKNCNSKISVLQKADEEEILFKVQLRDLNEAAANILDAYRNKKSIPLSTFQVQYQERIKKSKELQRKIEKIPDEKTRKKLILTLQKNVVDFQNKRSIHLKTIENLKTQLSSFEPLVQQLNNQKSTQNATLSRTTHSVEWDDIIFYEGSISVKYRGKWLENFKIKNATKSLNTIKAHYKFRNAPKLEIEVTDNKIIKVANVEVLFYYIELLENAGTKFFKNKFRPIPVFSKYKIYTKAYYKKHFPKIFQSDCFEFLCQYADDNLPIIPVPEIVINNSNGVTQIDDSFLFPFVSRKTIYLLWESVEESKATYLFQTLDIDFESQLQTIYDYLTGDKVNKRETLIRSLKMKKQLCLKTRVMHTDIGKWKEEVRMHANQS